MGKFEKKRKAEHPSPEEYPEVPAFLQEPRRITGEEDYSLESLRQLHEGRAVYESASVRRSGARNRAPAYDPREPVAPAYGAEAYASPAYEEPAYAPPAPKPPKRRKKRRLLRALLRILGLLLVLFLLAGLASVLLAKMPRTDQPIGLRKAGCCSILLCGTDAEGARTDTMVLLYLDRNAKRARLLSLPRDTMVNRDNPVPKLNGAYWANGGDRGDREQGMDALLDYVKDLVGYRPDGYLLIDLNCFESLVNLMGGVKFDVPMDMFYNDPSQDLFIDLKQGLQHLNGEEAMWLVRFRSGYAMADLDRIRVQRDFLKSAVDQWKSPLKLVRAPFALGLLLKNTETDLDWRNLCWLGLTLARCAGDLDSDTLPGEPAWVNGGAYYVENRQAAASLVNEKYNPYETEITAEALHPYGH